MFGHYIKTAFRNLWKYKIQSLTGIFGLAFGLACFVPALYWLRYETSYDGFYPGAEHIYRVYSVETQTGKTNEYVSGILERELHEKVPATETSTVFFVEPINYTFEETPHIRLRTIFADSTFLRVFPQQIVSGDTWQPLQIENNIVITETVAIRLFGDVEKAIGQPMKNTTLKFNPPYTVTAVVKDPPPNTNVGFDAILFHEHITLHKAFVASSPEQIWTFGTLQMYVRFSPQADVEALANQMRDLYADANREIHMMPISDVRYQLNAGVPFTLNFIRLLVASGILLLASALFNFLNLYLDLFRRRIRELRQRAIHGAKSRQLTLQMLFELACAVLLALVLGCCLVMVIRPAFSGLLDIAMGMSQVIRLFVICGVGIMVLVLSISLILFLRLSRLAMRPLSKGKTTGPLLRRMAVTLQLAVSVVFIVAALVVMKQMRFVNHKDLGFDSSGIIHLLGMNLFIGDNVRTALLSELASIPQIEEVTDAYFEPQHQVNTLQMKTEVEWPGKPQSEEQAFCLFPTDNRFAEVFGVDMLMGKWLEEGEQFQFVLNEEAVRVMGLEEPVGSVIRMPLNSREMHEFRVVGVVKDFHTMSLRNRIPPSIFMTSFPTSSLYMRVVPGQEQEVMQRIRAILPQVDPAFVDVEPILLDEMYDRLNYSEQAGLQLFSILATVCLLISLLGIYAVATAATQRRRKEIAIRKVAGAKAGDIVRLFFREYILQVAIAGAFALPLAYLAMSRWLQGYAYRTNIPGWLLVGVMVGVIAIVLFTVWGQVRKAANSNPAEVIKTE